MTAASCDAATRLRGLVGAACTAESLGEVERELLCSIASITAVTLAQIDAREAAVDAERRRLRMSRYLAPQVARYVDRSPRDRCPPVRRPRPDHAAAAVAAARRMVEAAASIPGRPDGRSEPIRIGVGLHSGEVVVGDIGGAAFLDFTIIGSTVNLAARVEEQTKLLGRASLATRATIELLPPQDRPAWSREVKLRGFEHAVHLYALDEPR